MGIVKPIKYEDLVKIKPSVPNRVDAEYFYSESKGFAVYRDKEGYVEFYDLPDDITAKEEFELLSIISGPVDIVKDVNFIESVYQEEIDEVEAMALTNQSTSKLLNAKVIVPVVVMVTVMLAAWWLLLLGGY